MPQLFQAADIIGTIHYSRFTVLSEKTLLFLGDFDGEFGQLMSDLALQAGPVFDNASSEQRQPQREKRIGQGRELRERERRHHQARFVAITELA